MKNRLDLHEILCGILGSRNVYFQPPESVKMKYPAIVYSLNDIDNTFADDTVYTQTRAYQVIVIDEDPDTLIAVEVSKLPTCKFTRSYETDNLNHFVFILYY